MQLLRRHAFYGLVTEAFCLHYSNILTLNIVIPTREDQSDSELAKQSHPYCTAVIICYAFLNIKLLCSRLVCFEIGDFRKAITVYRQHRCERFFTRNDARFVWVFNEMFYSLRDQRPSKSDN